jgi:PEP-CTERM motif
MNTVKTLVAALAVAASSVASAAIVTIDDFSVVGNNAYGTSANPASTALGGITRLVTGSTAQNPNGGSAQFAYGVTGGVFSLANGISSANTVTIAYSGIAGLLAPAANYQVVFDLVASGTTGVNSATEQIVISFNSGLGTYTQTGGNASAVTIVSAAATVGNGFSITLTGNPARAVDLDIDNIKALTCGDLLPTSGGVVAGVGGTSVTANTTGLQGGCSAAVPAPTSLALLGLGFAGLAAFRRKAK